MNTNKYKVVSFIGPMSMVTIIMLAQYGQLTNDFVSGFLYGVSAVFSICSLWMFGKSRSRNTVQ